MPKKFLNRWLPAPHKILNSRAIKWMGPLFMDPNLFHINKVSISTSFFIGLFVAFLPIPGQTILAALLAFFFRSNLPVAVALVWISNPLTVAPLFMFTYSIGVLLLGLEFTALTIELSWSWVISQGKLIWLPLLTGSLVTGFICGGLGYIAIHQLWKWKVLKNWALRQKKRSDV
ncbi:MAG: hypothetical protein ACI9LL_000380 [Porticoccus sp.]|jgi:uncharacterized protein (DUF2062 family)